MNEDSVVRLLRGRFSLVPNLLFSFSAAKREEDRLSLVSLATGVTTPLNFPCDQLPCITSFVPLGDSKIVGVGHWFYDFDLRTKKLRLLKELKTQTSLLAIPPHHVAFCQQDGKLEVWNMRESPTNVGMIQLGSKTSLSYRNGLLIGIDPDKGLKTWSFPSLDEFSFDEFKSNHRVLTLTEERFLLVGTLSYTLVVKGRNLHPILFFADVQEEVFYIPEVDKLLFLRKDGIGCKEVAKQEEGEVLYPCSLLTTLRLLAYDEVRGFLLFQEDKVTKVLNVTTRQILQVQLPSDYVDVGFLVVPEESRILTYLLANRLLLPKDLAREVVSFL